MKPVKIRIVSAVQDENGCWNNITVNTVGGDLDMNEVAFIRVCCEDINDSSIITINEEILYADEAVRIINNLTNVTVNNDITLMRIGESYTSKVIIPMGYELGNISVTMGGVDITSSVYSNGVITISEVTGDLIITIVANEIVVAYTNQIPISKDKDGKVYNGIGYKSGYRLDSSGNDSALPGAFVTGYIPCKLNDIIRMKNFGFTYGMSSGVTSSNQRVSFYDESFTHLTQTTATGLGGVAAGVKGSDDVWTQFTVKSPMNNINTSKVAFFRINGHYIGSDTIITVNEEITD